jgi:hypothetical protein
MSRFEDIIALKRLVTDESVPIEMLRVAASPEKPVIRLVDQDREIVSLSNNVEASVSRNLAPPNIVMKIIKVSNDHQNGPLVTAEFNGERLKTKSRSGRPRKLAPAPLLKKEFLDDAIYDSNRDFLKTPDNEESEISGMATADFHPMQIKSLPVSMFSEFDDINRPNDVWQRRGGLAECGGMDDDMMYRQQQFPSRTSNPQSYPEAYYPPFGENVYSPRTGYGSPRPVYPKSSNSRNHISIPYLGNGSGGFVNDAAMNGANADFGYQRRPAYMQNQLLQQSQYMDYEGKSTIDPRYLMSSSAPRSAYPSHPYSHGQSFGQFRPSLNYQHYPPSVFQRDIAMHHRSNDMMMYNNSESPYYAATKSGQYVRDPYYEEYGKRIL